MNSATWMKFLAAVLLFAAWLALVIIKMVPAGEFVFAPGQALIGLGVYHATQSGVPQLSGIEAMTAELSPAAVVAPAVVADPTLAAAVQVAPAVPAQPTLQ